MIKQFLLPACAMLGTLALSACVFNPQHSVSKEQQCLSLQHEMLFAGTFNPAKTTDVSVVNQREILQKKFQELHCYSVLEASRASQPGK